MWKLLPLLLLGLSCKGGDGISTPSPALLVVTSGSETCTIARMVSTSPEIGEVCLIGTTRIAPAPQVLVPGIVYWVMFDLLGTGDGLLIKLTVDGTGVISWAAVASPGGEGKASYFSSGTL